MQRILTIVLSLMLTAPAWAQSTTTEAPATDETPAEVPADTPQTEEPATDNGLTMGTDAEDDGELRVGQPYTKEEIGDWTLQCVKSEGDEDPCQLYQLVEDDEGNPVAEFSLFRLPEGGQAAAGATVVVPLETALTEDLLLGIDGTKGKRYRFSFCSTVGCFARIGLTQADVDALKRGQMANLTITPFAAPDVKVRLNMSLIGFTAGYEKVTVAAPQQR